MTDEKTIYEGGCACGEIRYRMESKPLVVHCCHCTWCQRETGASFALNAMIEADRVTILHGDPEVIDTPSNSGKGQKIWRCPRCHVAVWSNYAAAKGLVNFIRVGTLDEAWRLPPDIHIFTATKQPWVVIPEGQPAVKVYYDRKEYWSEESIARRNRIISSKES